MRLVFGGFLIVSGLAMAAVGLDRPLTSASHTDPPPSKPKSATSGEPLKASKLPTGQADGVLLALVKHHSGAACGSCPLGQQPSANGRCVPEAIAGRVASYQSLAHPSVDPGTPRASNADSPQTSRRTRRRAQIEGRMGVGGPPIVAKPSNQISRIAAAQAPPPEERPAVRQRREKRAARHVNRRLASHSRGYLRPMRAPRYAYRPRGIAALLFGWF